MCILKHRVVDTMDLMRTSGFRRMIMAGLTVAAANAFVSTEGQAHTTRSHGGKHVRAHAYSVSFNVSQNHLHNYFVPAHYAHPWNVHSRYSAHFRTAAHFSRSHYGSHVIQCVAFAQAESAVELHGNARDWWYNAAGRYARGSAPEMGSVLNFRPVRKMPLGHVAVVRDVVNSRVIVIDQSHWAQNGISRNVRVVDVSPGNDWSAVRVELNGRSGSFGSIYPTFGFIYPRSTGASQVMTASAESGDGSQVAEAPENAGTIEEGYRAPRRAAHPLFRHAHRVIHHRHR